MSLAAIRDGIEARLGLQDSVLWFVVAEKPPTQEDADALGLPLVSLQVWRDHGGLLDVSDTDTARCVNRFRDGLRGLTAVVWVTDLNTVATYMPDAFAHRTALTILEKA